MYRAARAAGADWRFFTSQVEIDQFEIAFRGVQALGLNGMALFDPFQTKSLELLDSVTESAMCLGRVNVARLDGNSWLGDNTLGAAIMNCIQPRLEQTHTAVPSEPQDAAEYQPPSILVVGESEIAKAMRLANTPLSDRIVVAPAGNDIVVKETEDGSASATRAAWELASLDDFVEMNKTLDCLVLNNVPNALLTRQLSALSWSDSPSCLIMSNASDKRLRSWREAIKVPNLTHIDLVELMAHQSAADFQFWTGVSPVIEQIRDSLEEYMQW